VTVDVICLYGEWSSIPIDRTVAFELDDYLFQFNSTDTVTAMLPAKPIATVHNHIVPAGSSGHLSSLSDSLMEPAGTLPTSTTPTMSANILLIPASRSRPTFITQTRNSFQRTPRRSIRRR
jgi:hypothetical protein